MKYAVHVGGHEPEAVAETRQTIMDIVAAPAGDTVKIAALKALRIVLGAPRTTISHCHIGGSTDTHNHYHQDDDVQDEQTDAVLDDEPEAEPSTTDG
jgi:hypothetical protein